MIIKNLYTELCTCIATIPAIKHIDLWHNQINHLDINDEHPWVAPAVFLNFRWRTTQDIGKHQQDGELQIDVYLFYESFLDTHHKAWNQGSALAFLDLLDELNKILHGSHGNSYEQMTKQTIEPIDTGNAGNLYRMTYSAIGRDYSAAAEDCEANVGSIEVYRNDDETPFFII